MFNLDWDIQIHYVEAGEEEGLMNCFVCEVIGKGILLALGLLLFGVIVNSLYEKIFKRRDKG